MTVIDKELYKKIVNIPLAVIIASVIIVIVTTGMTNENGVSALIGGYSGLLLGILFIIILNLPSNNLLDFFPFITIIIIIILIIYYLSTYFKQISKGEVSSYYQSFSILSMIFLATQMVILFSAMFGDKSSGELSGKLLSDKTFALLGLFGVINFLIVITLGIILHFYSTQG
jgi:hypothetical protein